MLLLAVILATAIIIAASVFLNISGRKMNPVVAFIWILVIMADTIILRTPIMMFGLFTAVVITKIFVASRLWKAYLKMSAYMLIFIVIFNILLVHSGNVLWRFWIFEITDSSLIFAYTMGMRLMVIMCAFALFSSNVSTDELMQILEYLRVPQRAYMSIAIAFRFLDVLEYQARETMLAARARGIPTGEGIKNRIRYRYPVMMSLMKNSLDRAMDIAETLELRGFPSSKRLLWRRPKTGVVEMATIATLLISAIVLMIIHGEIPGMIAIFTLPLSALPEVKYDD